ncbi:MAG: FAD-dependent oxidoreductase, partial [Clostridiales bacterium]|nr:FAD-dependent oxidoreductase [Clostridiales bacterium]
MSEINLTINGCLISAEAGQTILQIAQANGFNIPTLCHDERVEMYGACGICMVETKDNAKLLRSCSTMAADGMVITTDSERVYQSRKTALELLLSNHEGDCRPPCALACPAHTDCQGYVGLIANGEYEEALKLIKDKIPLPASIGRVCPHPCEEACRRELVEEPIAIASLKQFVGDIDLAKDKLLTAAVGAPSGKKVAIVGGGPGGLTAAYFLRSQGHEATIYDAMPLMGGMLRYGIPEYRLPKALLQKEIDAIHNMGVKFCNSIRIGRDLTLEELRQEYDAIVVAVGAWVSVGTGCPGEELEGVVGGIDFLQELDINNPILQGQKVAVVGGGNTAMDACRSALRLGAEQVYNIYRRTKNEMPAEAIEISEAEEEGVVFKNLTNPNEIIGENGKVTALRLQIMTLGEPDASGRRRPVPLAGEEETIEIDKVILAIGQKLNSQGLEALAQTRWGTLLADEHTMLTNVEGVFAVGDATNDGAGIAITAIAEAKQAALMVDKYLQGQPLAYRPPFLVKDEKTAQDFVDEQKLPRIKMPQRSPAIRRQDFAEVNLGFSEEEAIREAKRCLECGCHDYFECKLINYAHSYQVQPEKYPSQIRHMEKPAAHPFIQRNDEKCILCGLCVRICDEVVGASALGLVGRGFETIVQPALGAALQDTDCISCAQCVYVCPTGALTETMLAEKQVPVEESYSESVCAFCSLGCPTRLAGKGRVLLRSLPANEKNALLCYKGRFGLAEINKGQRLTLPLVSGKN